MTDEWVPGLVILIVSVAAIFGGYALLKEAYGACSGASDVIGDYEIPPNISLMSCLTSTPLLVLWTVGGSVCISAGFWYAFSGLMSFIKGLVKKK